MPSCSINSAIRNNKDVLYNIQYIIQDQIESSNDRFNLQYHVEYEKIPNSDKVNLKAFLNYPSQIIIGDNSIF